MQAVMISCIQRQRDREESLRQLSAAGVDNVRVILDPCGPATPGGTLRAARKALQEPGDILFLEDDIQVNPELFPRQLKAAIKSGVTTYLYITDLHEQRVRQLYEPFIANRIINRQSITPGLYEIQNLAVCFGTLAVYLPESKVRDLREALEGHPVDDTPFDVFLTRYLPRAYTALPHPVQHRAGFEGKRMTEAEHAQWREFIRKQRSWSFETRECPVETQPALR